MKIRCVEEGAEGYGDASNVGPDGVVSPEAFPDLILDVGVLVKGDLGPS